MGIDRGINPILNIVWCRGLSELVVNVDDDEDGDRAIGELGD